MNRIFVAFIIFLFGVMAGYGWQYYHRGLKLTDYSKKISGNNGNYHQSVRFDKTGCKYKYVGITQ